MQKDNKISLSERVLHLWSDGSVWLELPNGSCSLAEGGSWSISKILTKDSQTSVFQLQYKPRGNGSRGVQENVEGNRGGKNGRIRKGQAERSKSLRPLR